MEKGKLASGDILIVKDGATTGKTSLVRPSFPYSEAAINEHVFRLRLDKKQANATYIFYFLFSPKGQRDILKDYRGATVGGISRSFTDGVSVPLPPLAEQRRIADILDKADAIRRKRWEAGSSIERLPLSLFAEMFGTHASPAKDVALSAVAQVVSGVTKGRRLSGVSVRTVPYLRVANVQAGHLDLREIKTIEALSSEVANLALQHGDVVMTEGGDHDKLGRGAIWEHDVPDCIHQNHVFRVRLDRTRVLPNYFATFLQTGEAKAYFLRCAKKTTNLASINITQLKSLPVPLAPLSQQSVFVDRLAKCLKLRDRMRNHESAADALFHSLVQRAFRGEL